MSFVLRGRNVPAGGRRRRNRRRGKRQQTVIIQNSNQRRRPQRRRAGRRSRRSGRGGAQGKPHAYLKSLIEPEHFTARIPDTNSWESTVFQQITDTTLTTAADGSFAYAISPTAVAPTSAGFSAAVLGLGTNAAGFWSTQAAQNPAQSAAILSAFDLLRPVSGSLTAEFIGTTSSDSGQMCAYPLFRGQTAASNFAASVNQSFNLTVPVRNGVRMLWKPMDNADTEYEECLAASIYGLYSAAGVTPPKNSGSGAASSDANPPTCLVVCGTGAAASTACVRVRAVFNYEAIPTSDGLQLFQTVNEPAQPTVMAQAVNMVGQLPWADVWTGVSGLASSMMSQALESQITPAIGGLVSSRAMSYLRGGPSSRRLSIMDDID